MKPVYWRPKKCSPTTTLVIGLFAMFALAAVELLPRLQTSPTREQQIASNQLASLCRDQLRHARTTHGLKINRDFDSTQSGMLGKNMTPITSKPGNLESKQLTLHPQFPATVIQLLRDAGVEEGDTVAIGWTGSFPALNVAVAAAIETLRLRPLAISSVCSSQYGANEPEFTWLDMENTLHEAELLSFRSVAATIGGPLDHGAGMDETAIVAAKQAAERNSVRMLKSKRLSGLIDARMRVVDKKAGSERITAFINVGGGIASSGGRDSVFPSGLTASVVENVDAPDCMMQRMVARGVPVLNVAHPQTLAKKFGLSKASETWAASELPRQPIQKSTRFVAGFAFVGICTVLSAFVLQDTGNKLVHQLLARLQGKRPMRAVGNIDGPQLMV